MEDGVDKDVRFTLLQHVQHLLQEEEEEGRRKERWMRMERRQRGGNLKGGKEGQEKKDMARRVKKGWRWRRVKVKGRRRKKN